MKKQSWSFFIGAIFLFSTNTACSSNKTPEAPTSTQPTYTLTTTIEADSDTLTPTTQSTDTAAPQTTETAAPTLIPTLDHFSSTYPLSENEFVIPLTVRHVTDERATFFFELQNPADGILVYRNTQTHVQEEIAFSTYSTRQMLTIEGLTPGAAYETRIVLGDIPDGIQQPGFAGKEWGTIHFHNNSNDWPLMVGVLGDASFGDDATQMLVNLIASQNLDFIIHTGDVVYETDGSDPINSYVRKFFQPFAPLLHLGPIYTVLGNHDYDSALRLDGVPSYDYIFPPFPNPDFSFPETRRGNQYYALAFRDIQFIMLDTHVFAGATGRAEQDTWIEERLADPRFRITIPVFHVAPYSSSIVHPDDGLPVRYSWNWRFEQANVPLVLSGHFHHYERLIANGITYIVSGGGSSTLYAQGETLPESQIYARKTHFVLLEMFENYINLIAISMEGDIIDQTTIPLD